jgi:hypothetical protein
LAKATIQSRRITRRAEESDSARQEANWQSRPPLFGPEPLGPELAAEGLAAEGFAAEGLEVFSICDLRGLE